MKKLMLFLALVTIVNLNAQEPSPQQQAKELLKKAIQLMDNGEYEASIDMLEDAIDLDQTPSITPMS
jgi:Tfp pilus assembly protein PilF